MTKAVITAGDTDDAISNGIPSLSIATSFCSETWDAHSMLVDMMEIVSLTYSLKNEHLRYFFDSTIYRIFEDCNLFILFRPKVYSSPGTLTAQIILFSNDKSDTYTQIFILIKINAVNYVLTDTKYLKCSNILFSPQLLS